MSSPIPHQIVGRPKCETEGCTNEAIGRMNGKWRCGACIIRYEKNIRNKCERLFIEE